MVVLGNYNLQLAILALCLVSYSLASDTQTDASTNRKYVRDCTTQLAGDLYGLGVRLGVYFQWLSGWVSNNYLSDEINGGLNTNAIFLLAILIAVVNSTLGNEMTIMDGLVMIWLCAGTVGSVLSIWGYRTRAYREDGPTGIQRFGGFGTHLRLMLCTAVAAYSIWYWALGVHGGNKGMEAFGEVVNGPCDKPDVTVFGLNVSGRTAPVALAFSFVLGLYSVLQTFGMFLAGFTRIRKMAFFWTHKLEGGTTRLRFATGATQQQ